MTAECSVNECSGRTVARGWCVRHYASWRKHGDPLRNDRRNAARVTVCVIDTCAAPASSRGWCKKHYLRWRRRGHTDDPKRAANGLPLLYLLSKRFEETDDCMIWPFAVADTGYGQLGGGRAGKFFVHVLACTHLHGLRPAGMAVAHGPCHNRLCFNPRHLSWETPAENAADRLRDGTHQRGERATGAKLTWAERCEIVAKHAAGASYASIAREYPVVSVTQIRRVARYESFTRPS